MQHIHMSLCIIIRIRVLDDRYRDMFYTDSDKIQSVI